MYVNKFELFLRNPMSENFDTQKQKVIKFGEMWREFDWTRSLNQKRDEDSASDSD